jgi:hypothetical protein
VKLNTLVPALLNLDYVCTLWTDVADTALYVLHVPVGEVPSRGLHYVCAWHSNPGGGRQNDQCAFMQQFELGTWK